MKPDQKLMARYRMLVSAGGLIEELKNETDEELIKRVKANSIEEKCRMIAELVSLVPESFWKAHGI